MKDTANQGALANGVIAAQGSITNAGYTEQAESYETMAAAGYATAASENQMAGETDTIATEQQGIAAQQQQLATATQNAANSQATGDFVGALVCPTYSSSRSPAPSRPPAGTGSICTIPRRDLHHVQNEPSQVSLRH